MQRVWSTYLGSNGSHGHGGLAIGAGTGGAGVGAGTGAGAGGRGDRGESPGPDVIDNNSPRASVISHTNSAYSHAGSTRPMLVDMSNNSSSADLIGGGLQPPSAPFSLHNHLQQPFRRSASGLSDVLLSPVSGSGRLEAGDLDLDREGGSTSGLSLSVHHLPSKFSTNIVSPGGHSLKKRKRGSGVIGAGLVPKRGGGADVFRSGEARMPGMGRTRRMRWNRFKWALFVANTIFMLYSLTGLIVTLLVWFDAITHADILRIGNRPELVLSTLAASLGVLTSLVGYAGLLLNNRAFLAWYTFLTWLTFALLLVPGYMTYKKHTFNLEGKINKQWSQDLGASGRLGIQNALGCCGYFSPYIEATVSQTCYARSLLDGCKAPYVGFEKGALRRWYTCVFGLVPLQLGVMVLALVCANHVTYRFGKGMMPERYRLDEGTVRAVVEAYVRQLADEYGHEVAHEVVRRAQLSGLNLNLNLDLNSGSNSSANSSSPEVPVSEGEGKQTQMPVPVVYLEREGAEGEGEETHAPIGPYHVKYRSLGGVE